MKSKGLQILSGCALTAKAPSKRNLTQFCTTSQQINFQSTQHVHLRSARRQGLKICHPQGLRSEHMPASVCKPAGPAVAAMKGLCQPAQIASGM